MRRPNEVEYGITALMANWYEERLAPQQLQRDPYAQKSLRRVEEGISIPVNRNPPYITKEIIVPDDGYRELRTEFQTKFDAKNIQNMQLGDCRSLIKTNCDKVKFPECNSTVAQTVGAKSIKQLDQTNIHQILVERGVHQNYTDFGSTFRNHSEQYNKFQFITTSQQSFQQPENNVQQILTDKKKKPKASGCCERDLFDQGLKMTSVITGEKYRDSMDPKVNTQVQRQWIHYGDVGLKTAQNNLKQSIYPYDIATSLPLADGVYTLHSKYTDPGQFRHIRSDVTRIMNKPITNIFCLYDLVQYSFNSFQQNSQTICVYINVIKYGYKNLQLQMNEQEYIQQQLRDLEEKCIYQDNQIARLQNDNKDTYLANHQLTQQILSLDNIVNQLIMENQFLRNENDQIKQNSYKTQSKFYSSCSDQDLFEPNQEIIEMINQKQKKLKELKLVQQKEESKLNQSNKIVQSLLDEVVQDKIMNLQMDITALQQLLQQ